jgi:hypothetical protein
MPTPIQHLVIAESLLKDSTLPDSIRAQLSEQRGPFLFGNTAPDVQTVSGQPREATHFFDIPLRSTLPPHEVMLEHYPALAQARKIPPAQAAFMVGYICHLSIDVLWVRDIYLPAFGPQAHWATMRERLLYHNILRSWCDRNDQQQLNGRTGPSLASVQPQGWLPFTADRYLLEWRQVLVDQFQPGASIRTIEVFAERNRVSPQEFRRLLESPQELAAHIFAHASHDTIDRFYQQAHNQMAELIVDYWSAST